MEIHTCPTYAHVLGFLVCQEYQWGARHCFILLLCNRKSVACMWRKREHLKSPCHLAHFYPEINTLITLERINATRLYRWVANWQPNWQPEKSGWELATGRVRFWPKGSVMPEDADVGNLEHISPTFCKPCRPPLPGLLALSGQKSTEGVYVESAEGRCEIMHTHTVAKGGIVWWRKKAKMKVNRAEWLFPGHWLQATLGAPTDFWVADEHSCQTSHISNISNRIF